HPRWPPVRRDRRRRVGPSGHRARCRRDPAQLDGRRRHAGRIRPGDDPRRACGDRPAAHRQWRRGPSRALPARGRRGRGRRARRECVPLRHADDPCREGDAASRRARGPVTTTDTLDTLGGGTHDLTRRGFGVMGRGIMRQRLMFTWAALASLLFGVMTVADAWVLGWATEHVITPSLAERRVTAGALGAGVGLFLLAALLRTIGVIGRRLLGGVVFFRLVRDDRLRVTRRYLQLP